MKAIFTVLVSLLLLSIPDSHAAEDSSFSEVKSGKLVSSLRVTGHVVPLDGALAMQSARIPGRVTAILRREGDHVQLGTPLLSVNSAECVTLTEEVRVAKERNLTELIDSSKKRASELDLQVGQNECKLVASASGTITKRMVEVGATFQIGDNLFQIVNTHRLTVEFDVPEKDIHRIAAGKKISFTLPSDPGQEYKSQIFNVVPALDTVSRTNRIRVAPVDFRRVPSVDSYALGEIDTGILETTLIVPTSALVFHQDHQWVLKKELEKMVAVAVEVLDESSAQSSVRPLKKDSLTPGDQVVSKGAIYQFRQLSSKE